MAYRITKATVNMVNGDKLVLKPNVIVDDVETYRTEIETTYVCKRTLLVYEETENTNTESDGKEEKTTTT